MYVASSSWYSLSFASYASFQYWMSVSDIVKGRRERWREKERESERWGRERCRKKGNENKGTVEGEREKEREMGSGEMERSGERKVDG